MDCPGQWKIDVNAKYQQAVGVVTSLASGSMVLPIFFLKDVAGAAQGDSMADLLTRWAYAGWTLLTASILSAICYYYCSAKWVKQSWGQNADMFGRPVTEKFVERSLDITYFIMMTGFITGLFATLMFMVTFSKP